MLSYTEENYIKAIYALTSPKGKGAATTKISEALNTKASSVTDMLRRLAEKNLVDHQKYQGAKLTETGRQTALNVVRKHRLWEVFLVNKLNFKWDEVHELAEQLEHIQSKELTNRLDAFLGFPQHDPHGDPIPNANGTLPQQKRSELSAFTQGDVVSVLGVKDTSSAFLQYLEKMKIAIGTHLEILDIFEFDGSMQIKIQDRATLNISKNVATNLYVNAL